MNPLWAFLATLLITAWLSAFDVRQGVESPNASDTAGVRPYSNEVAVFQDVLEGVVEADAMAMINTGRSRHTIKAGFKRSKSERRQQQRSTFMDPVSIRL